MDRAMPEAIEVCMFVGLLVAILRYVRDPLVLSSITEHRAYAVKNSARDNTWTDSAALGKALINVFQYGKTAVLVFEGGVSLIINFGQGAYATTAWESELATDPVLSSAEGSQCVCALRFAGFPRLVIIHGCNTSFAAQVATCLCATE